MTQSSQPPESNLDSSNSEDSVLSPNPGSLGSSSESLISEPSDSGDQSLPTTATVSPGVNQMIETGKATVSDTVTAIKQLQQDPTQGLMGALQSLGDERAFKVGLFLCIVFPIVMWSAIVRGVTSVFGVFDALIPLSNFDIGIAEHIRGLLLCGTPVYALILGFIGIRKCFNAKGTVNQYTFITGICLLPITLNALLFWILGFNGLELSSLFAIISSSLLVLLLNSAVTNVLGLTAQKSLWLVPLLLVVLVFSIQVFFGILY